MQEEGPLAVQDNNNKRHLPRTRPELIRANLSSCQLYRGKTSMYYDRYQGAAPNLFSSSAKYNANGRKFPLDWGSSMKGRKDVSRSSTEIKPVEIANQSSENIMPEDLNTARAAEVETEQPWKEPEGWGVKETAEAQQSSPSKIVLLETETSALRQRIQNMEEDKSKAVEEINSAKLNGKLLVKDK